MDRLWVLVGQERVAWPWGENVLEIGRNGLPRADAFRLEDERSYSPLPTIAQATWPRMQIALVTSGGFEASYHCGLRSRHFVVTPGALFIYPAGCELAKIRLSGRFRMLVVEAKSPLVRQLTRGVDTLTTGHVEPQHNIRDAGLARLIRALESDVRRGCPTGRLYSEHLSLTIASYVLGRYAAAPEIETRVAARALSKTQRARITDFIHANLERGFSTLDLASVVCMSPRHFGRLFRATFDESPHRYVMRLRLDRARALLENSAMTLCDIAFAVGFGSQSYFTDLFRRTTGFTPRQYRLHHGGRHADIESPDMR